LPAPQRHNHRNVVIATEARKTAAVAGLRMAKDVGDLADRVVFVVDQVDLVVRVVFVEDPIDRVVFVEDQVVGPADRVVGLRPK
jgi:hypothetical protein